MADTSPQLQQITLAEIGTLLTAAGALGAAILSWRRTARSDELTLMREELKRLHDNQKALEARVSELQTENARLYRILARNGIDARAEIEHDIHDSASKTP